MLCFARLFSNALCVLKSIMGQKAASYCALKRINCKIIRVSEANQRDTLRELPAFSLWTTRSWQDFAFTDVNGHFAWSQDLTFGPPLASSNTLLAHRLQRSLTVDTTGTGYTERGHQAVALSCYKMAAVL